MDENDVEKTVRTAICGLVIVVCVIAICIAVVNVYSWKVLVENGYSQKIVSQPSGPVWTKE